MSADPPRILSVEDDALNRALLRASLTGSDEQAIKGATLVEATTLADARQALADAPYDLVLLDHRLPDGDGFDLMTELATRAEDRPRVVALTADAVPQTHEAALRAGCDAIVIKPYRPRDLVAVVVEQLATRAGERRD